MGGQSPGAVPAHHAAPRSPEGECSSPDCDHLIRGSPASPDPLRRHGGEHAYGFGGFGRYSQTKLANILFTVELARLLRGTGVTANCFHPGFVTTGFNRNNGPLMRFGMNLARVFARSPEKGAETLVWLVDSPEVSDQSGGYYFDKRLTSPSPAAQDADAARRLWAVSQEQTRASAVPD